MIISISQKPLYDDNFNRILDVPKNAVFETLETTTHEGTQFERVDYRGNVGWLQVDYTDPYSNSNERDIVYLADIQTDDPNDAEQFVMWENTSGKMIRCLNQCGEICVSRILNRSLSDVLTDWRDSGAWHYSHVFQGSEKDRGTDEAGLQSVLGISGAVSLEEYFDGIYTPYRFAEALRDNYIIYGVSINSASGDLVTNKDVAHWVLIEEMVVNGTNGLVTLFNPFDNEMQQESWRFLQLSAQAFSAGGFSGLVVPRRIVKDKDAALLRKEEMLTK